MPSDSHPPKQPGAFAQLQDEVVQGPATRRPLYEAIEQDFGAHYRVVALFTSFSWQVSLADEDADMLEEVLRNTMLDGEHLVVLLNSPGGDALAAERIVNICNAFSKDGFSVVVPKMAKSAATMVCLGATQIGMSQNSELGPIDPQIFVADDPNKPTSGRYLAAHEIRRSFNNLMQRAEDCKGRIEPLLQQLSRYDARLIEWIASQQELSKSIAIKLLKDGVLNGRSASAIEKRIRPFLDPDYSKVHGRPIYHDTAKQCGLNIDLYDLKDQRWGRIWELYVRLKHVVTDNRRPTAKVIESARETFSAHVTV